MLLFIRILAQEMISLKEKEKMEINGFYLRIIKYKLRLS